MKSRIGLQISAAYVSDLWIGILTAISYGLTYVLLLHFILEQTGTIGGYTRTEMFLLVLTGQIAFFLLSFWSFRSNEELISQVNTGNLDFTLLRPISPLWNIATESIKVLDSGIRFLILIPLYALFVDWGQVDVAPINLLIAVVILLIGIFVEHVIHFMISVTAFWFGDAKNIQFLIYGLSTQRIPYESMPGWFKGLFTVVLPTYIVSSVAVSALLAKSDPLRLFAITVAVGVVFYCIKMLTWRAALKTYSSASS